MNTHAATDRLAELLCRKLQLLEEILSLSHSQLEYAQRDEVDSLIKLLGAKQTVLDKMQALQIELEPFRDEDPDQRVWHSQRRREQTRCVAMRCETLLGEIMQIEKQCEQHLVARRNEVAADLQAAGQADRARDAYSASPIATSGFEVISEA